MMGLYWDTGKETGNYDMVIKIQGFGFQTLFRRLEMNGLSRCCANRWGASEVNKISK